MASTEAVISAFAIVLGREQGDRRLAEQWLTALEVLDAYPDVLAKLASDEDVDVGIRQLAAITLKRYVDTHWSEEDCHEFKPPQPSDEVKTSVRSQLLQTLSSPIRLIRKAIAHSIITIAQYDWPDNWPGLLNELTRMTDEVAMSTEPDTERSKSIIHGAMQALVGLSCEISDLDLPQIAPVLVPSLVRILCDKQRFGNATRKDAVCVLNNLMHTALALSDESVFYALIGSHFRPCINSLVADLTSNEHAVQEAAFEGEILQLLTSLCVEIPGFVGQHVDGGLHMLTNALWQVLQRVTNSYVQLKVSSRRNNLDEVENEDIFDSDGESIEYDDLVYALLEFLSCLAGTKRYRSKLETYLPDVSYQLARLLQLPEAMLTRWSSSVADFLEDTQESFNYSVRLVALDVLKKFSNVFSNWSPCFNKTLSLLFSTTEVEHTRGDPDWWKLLEVSLYLAGTFSPCLVQTHLPHAHGDANGASSLQLETVCSRYLFPSLQQSDLPFLKASALHCVTEFSRHNYPNGPRLENLPAILVEALSPSQPPPLRAVAVKAVGSIGSLLRHSGSSSSTPQCLSIREHLPNLVGNVVDCLSSFGEPILDDGLYAVYSLLRIDPQGFTAASQGQVTAILVDLFKHCLSVASTLSIYLDVIRVVREACDPSSSEAVEQAFLPMLLTCLEQQESLESVVVEAALQVLCVLIRTSVPTLSEIFIRRVFPAVVNIAITSTDAVIISRCCDVLRCYLAVGVDRVLEWHDDEGNNGISYILHVTSRLLDPAGEVEWATAAGRLVCALIVRVPMEHLRENTDLLLRGTLVRLSNLPLISSKSSCSGRTLYSLDDSEFTSSDLEGGSVGGARQSLMFVFVVLCRLQPETLIDFLSSVPDPLGQPVMAKVMRLWCACQSFYFSNYETRISILALSNLLLHAIKTNDTRLMQITTPGQEIDDASSDNVAARTRKQQTTRRKRYLQIPLLVKMYKLLINELEKILEEEDDNDADEGYEESDVEGEDGEEGAFGAKQPGAPADGEHIATEQAPQVVETVSQGAESADDSDDGLTVDDPIFSQDPVMTLDLKDHLCSLFRTLSEQSFYNEFSRYHTDSELSVLQKVEILE